METKNQIIEAIIQRIKDEEKKHSKSIEDWYRIAANKIYATFDIKIKEKMSNNKQCQFEASRQTSSATICKWCGREKWQHNTTINNKQNSIIDMLKQDLDIEIKAGVKVIVNWDGYKAMERELIKESCIMAIMQWNEWDKTNYLDLYDHKVEGAEIWAEDYCKELYEEIEVPNPKQETHICKYCNAETWQSDDECYANPKITNNHIVDANKKVSSIEWLFDQMAQLCEDYDNGEINYTNYVNRVKEAKAQAKEMHKKEQKIAYESGSANSEYDQFEDCYELKPNFEYWYEETFGK